ncbi:MAG: hypothetical protein E7053_01160 [Lentisphaerae bacterium]|nr:hypothetical protein [Lentisphaerota bacterium]
MKKSQLPEKAKELLENGSVLITGADISDGVAERIQVYFSDEGEAVMDIISKDDLVQNFPEEGVFALYTADNGMTGEFKKVEMFEGAEDMYFRTDSTREESDEFAGVPTVSFMETVENICSLKLKKA